MNYDKKLFLSLLSVFLFVQAIGLYLGSKLVALPELEPQTSAAAGAFIFVYILLATGFILLIIKYFRKALKLLELIAVFFSTEIFFEVLFLGLVSVNIQFFSAIALAAIVTGARVFKPNTFTQNTAMLLSIMGVGAMLGANLGFLPAIVMLGLLTVYDVVAVFKTKHMVSMAREITKQKLAFTLVIPTKKRNFQLGGGDLVMPLIFTIAVLRDFGLLSAVFTVTGSMAALSLLFVHMLGKEKKPLPALPPVTIGALAGLGVSILVGGLL